MAEGQYKNIHYFHEDEAQSEEKGDETPSEHAKKSSLEKIDEKSEVDSN